MQGLTSKLLGYGLWAVVLIVALFLQAMPVLLVVTMFSLAIGIPKGAALIVIPVAFLGMVIVACLIATKLTRRHMASSGAATRALRGQPRSHLDLAAKSDSPSEYFRNLKRLG